ncbi:MAG: exo-alpha-sialidase [Planctomycetes bacterium]|nr:exo-alpha-sialidase [Planctomycetota bacterium]
MIQSQLLPGFLAVLAAVSGQPFQGGGQRQKYEPAVKLPDDFVRYARLPDGGIQPRVEVVGEAVVILYFKGDAAQGDLFLTRSKDEARTFEASVRLNAVPVLTQLVGHSGALDAGPDGRAHVIWVSGGEKPSLQYVRESSAGAFSPVQDLGCPVRLGLSPAVAVDGKGKVHVFYVAEDAEAAEVEGETPGLRVWMRTSVDGATFGPPVAIDAAADGVSDSSAVSAHTDRVNGTIYFFYLTAGRRGAPEVRLLSSTDGGATFVSKLIEMASRHNTPPQARPCLSQEIVTERTLGKGLTIVSWDTYAQVFWGGLDPRTRKLQGSPPTSPRFSDSARRLRASGIASGSEFLLAWLEHPVGDRSQPMRVGWQVWYAAGLVPLGWGQAPEPAGDSMPAVFANRERGFTIVY